MEVFYYNDPKLEKELEELREEVNKYHKKETDLEDSFSVDFVRNLTKNAYESKIKDDILTLKEQIIDEAKKGYNSCFCKDFFMYPEVEEYFTNLGFKIDYESGYIKW